MGNVKNAIQYLTIILLYTNVENVINAIVLHASVKAIMKNIKPDG